MVIDIVGGSIGDDSMGLETILSQIVSETEAFVKPAIHAISLCNNFLTGILLFPSKENNFC